jgi:chromate transporter
MGARPPEAQHHTVVEAPASCAELLRVFTRLALQGFGGVLPVAQRELVERRGWLTREQFLELLSLGQVLPGPNIVNMALIFGDRHFGVRGALAALAGLLLLPSVIVLSLAALYAGFAAQPAVAGALRGMGAVAAGLMVSTAVRLLSALKTSPLGRWAALGFAALTFGVIVLLRWPMAWVVPCVGVFSIAVAWWRLRATAAQG